nr:hypothetical protein Iba_chr11fCG3800 [Ipomoea batatas]
MPSSRDNSLAPLVHDHQKVLVPGPKISEISYLYLQQTMPPFCICTIAALHAQVHFTSVQDACPV